MHPILIKFPNKKADLTYITVEQGLQFSPSRMTTYHSSVLNYLPTTNWNQ